MLTCDSKNMLHNDTQSILKKHPNPWDWKSIVKKGESIISNCTTASWEGYLIYNMNVLFVWKYQVSSAFFWIERSEREGEGWNLKYKNLL